MELVRNEFQVNNCCINSKAISFIGRKIVLSGTRLTRDWFLLEGALAPEGKSVSKVSRGARKYFPTMKDEVFFFILLSSVAIFHKQVKIISYQLRFLSVFKILASFFFKCGSLLSRSGKKNFPLPLWKANSRTLKKSSTKFFKQMEFLARPRPVVGERHKYLARLTLYM